MTHETIENPNGSDLCVIRPTFPNVNFIYGTTVPAFHWMVWHQPARDEDDADHFELQQMSSSQEIGRLIERLMKEAITDWVCLVSRVEPDYPEEYICDEAIRAVAQGRVLHPHQKAFRQLPHELIEPNTRSG